MTNEDGEKECTKSMKASFRCQPEGIQGVKLLAEDGMITAASSSQICDGASGVMIVNEAVFKTRRQASCQNNPFVGLGHDPVIMLEALIPAVKKGIEKTGMSVDDIDVYEVNEAFGSVPVAFAKELGVDEERLNVHGGAIALGHPLGGSGTKLMTTLVHALKRKGGKYTACKPCARAVAWQMSRLLKIFSKL